jgi:hypothetical protein
MRGGNISDDQLAVITKEGKGGDGALRCIPERPQALLLVAWCMFEALYTNSISSGAECSQPRSTVDVILMMYTNSISSRADAPGCKHTQPPSSKQRGSIHCQPHPPRAEARSGHA